jgi:hypothetical protein
MTRQEGSTGPTPVGRGPETVPRRTAALPALAERRGRRTGRRPKAVRRLYLAGSPSFASESPLLRRALPPIHRARAIDTAVA